MAGVRIGVGSWMGLAVVVAIDLAMFRGVMPMLTIPAIAVFLVLLNLVLIRLLVLRWPLRPCDYGFLAVGFVAATLSSPFNNDPRTLRRFLDLYREVTGDARVVWWGVADSFLYLERAALGLLILAVATGGGLLSGWAGRRL
ncbi:hypothetical protein [Tautonia plasticadhaerens]|uniref:Uncharacterized protein n=1 Tax=Tautonia plasticadhaerens TaxID=2527974 RepID=A0A518H2Z8_9BACT|nr:hypothetical protein [Tautonia plasticadhaerens]QDV35211.1 hypothetical protein ElP_31140 [Tautonia plasticadhaerens]